MLETKIDVKKTAILVIDMQNDAVKATHPSFSELAQRIQAEGIVGHIAKVIAAARSSGMSVVYVNMVSRMDGTDRLSTVTDVTRRAGGSYKPIMAEGTPGAEVVKELKPAEGDYIVLKRRGNSFYATDLELLLRTRGIDTVIITGIVTEGCVAETVRGARERDFHVIVLSDCLTGMVPEDHEYYMNRAFPKQGRVRTSEEIVAALGALARA